MYSSHLVIKGAPLPTEVSIKNLPLDREGCQRKKRKLNVSPSRSFSSLVCFSPVTSLMPSTWVAEAPLGAAEVVEVAAGGGDGGGCSGAGHAPLILVAAAINSARLS